MVANTVTHNRGTVWEHCEEGDHGALPVEECGGYYGVAPWVKEAGPFVRAKSGRSQVSIKLNAVRPDRHGEPGAPDPNAEWAAYTPSGELTMVIDNPATFDYFSAGDEYRVTIEKIRGPRI